MSESKKREKPNRQKGKGKKRFLIIGGLALAAVIVLALVLGGKTGSGESEAAEETTTETAQIMDVENLLTSEGEVTSSLEEELSPHTSYYLEEVKVEAGDALEEGDTILTYTNGGEMTAPYNCVVETWSLPDEEDQLTTDHYVTVAGTDVMRMELSVAEDQIALIEAGDEASVQVDAVDKNYDGIVTSVSELGEYSGSGSTFTARVTFDNDGSVKLGMSGTATITLEKAEDALCVPVNAVTVSDNESKVTRQKDDGSTEEVTVTTGISNDAYIQITEGLDEGDVLVVPVTEEDSDSNGSMNMPGGQMPGDGGNGPGGDGSGMPGGGSGPPGQ